MTASVQAANTPFFVTLGWTPSGEPFDLLGVMHRDEVGHGGTPVVADDMGARRAARVDQPLHIASELVDRIVRDAARP